MKNSALRLILGIGLIVAVVFLGLFAIQGMPGWIASSSQTAIQGQAAQQATGFSIADIASTYYGALSRPLFPENSLFLPLTMQVVISLVLSVVILLTTLFFRRARVLMMFITTVCIARHLLWRGFDTLDFSNPVTATINTVLFAAEIFAFIYLVLGYFQIYKPTNRESEPIPSGFNPSVDIFVCTYNEPVSVLNRSLVGCKNIDYPNKQVYLLDDGNRPEMAQLAQRIGVNYLSRTENIHAKAGNLNNAMEKTHGDLILVFDADHVPAKTFLTEVVGFFSDQKMAFVQTPQHFFTPDPFQRNLVAEEVVSNEQDLFFHVIQPGNDYWNACFFAGSGAIFRRKALEGIGGFAVETITEDVHTGIRMHAEGWKSAFYNRNLAAGLAQDSFSDFIKQRLRWCRGMTQILFFDHPLTIKGLSLGQRLCYFSGIWYFFIGLPRAIFLITPLFFLLFGLKTMNAGFVEVLIYYLPSFLSIFLGYSIITFGFRQSFWGEVYETATCFYLMLTTFATSLSPKRAKFRVTPKGGLTDRVNFNWQVVFPQVVIGALTVFGIGMAITRAFFTPEYAGGIYTNLFWAIYNLILITGAVYVAQERPQFRLTPRVPRRSSCEVRLLDGTIAVGYTTDISESGVATVFDEPIPVAGTVALKVLDWEINETSVLHVQAVRSSVGNDGKHYVGFRVVNRTEEQHQKLIMHMFGSADTWQDDHVRPNTGFAFFNLLNIPFRLSQKVETPFRRRTPRFRANLPCLLISSNGTELRGYSSEISETGISVVVPKSPLLVDGQVLQVRLQWPTGQLVDLKGRIMRSDAAGPGEMRVGMNFVDISKEQRLDIIQQIYRPREGLVRVAPAVNRMLTCEIKRHNQQIVRATTQEISEMGVTLSTESFVEFMTNEPVLLQLFWQDGASMSFSGVVAGSQSGTGASGQSLLVYFRNLDMASLDRLNQKIHEPIENNAFYTPLMNFS